jgi:acyl-CoA synthetase (NDP forming)
MSLETTVDPIGLETRAPSNASGGSDVTLNALFNPRGVAFFGVPRRGRSLGGLALRFGLARPGNARMFVVHPEASEIHGVACYRSIEEIPAPVDVAFVAVPAEAVLGVIENCARGGVKFAIIGSSGFAESGERGGAIQAEVAEVARAHGVRLVGPNCNGLWNAVDRLSIGFNTSHGHDLRARPVGVVGQTGAVLGSFLAGVDHMGGGVAYAISTGNEADVDAAESFRFMADAPQCDTIVLLLDSITRPAIFEAAARTARRLGKAVIVYKFGKSSRGRHAAELHSSRVAGGSRAFSAWLRALGIAEAPDIESAMFAAAVLGTGQRPRAELGVLSTSGAGAAMIADLAEEWGLELPEFGADSGERLTELYHSSAPFNPLDLAGQSNDPVWLASVMDAVLTEPAFGMVALLSTLLPDKAQGVAPVVAEFAKASKRNQMPTCVYALGPLAEEHRADLIEVGIPIADSGATLFGGIDTLKRLRSLSVAPSRQEADFRPRRAADWPAAPGGTAASALVLHDEARLVLGGLGVPFVDERSVTDSRDAATALSELGGRVAIKLLDRSNPHKAAAGGLALNITDGRVAVEVAKRMMQQAVSADARLLVQRMTVVIAELFIGSVADSVVGPVIVVGRGGSDMEQNPDLAVELAPVSVAQAAGMLRSIPPVVASIAAAASRTGRSVDDFVSEIASIVSSISELAVSDSERVYSIDINPLAITEAGSVAALDVRVQLNYDSY